MIREVRWTNIVCRRLVALAAVAALTVTGAAACAPAEEGISTEGFSPACSSSSYVAALQADVPLDYVSRRAERRGTDAWSVSTIEQSGTVCATAKDRAACVRRVDELRRLTDVCVGNVASGGGCYVQYLLYTRGDDVGVAQSDAEIDALVGRVDSIDEALVVASHTGVAVHCGTPGFESAQYKVTGEGYEIIGVVETCEDRHQVLVRVTADGKVTETARVRVPGKAECTVTEL